MGNLIQIEPIAVKDKNDVVKALNILERIGIKRMTDEQKAKYLADPSRKVDNNFMIQEEDGGFRIQSHYIGFGISIENLEEQVNEILEQMPDLCVKIEEIETKKTQLNKEIEEKRNKLKKEIEKTVSEIKGQEDSFGIIKIKEKQK